MSTHKSTYRSAVNEALRAAMLDDSRIVLLGEDVGAAGGVFKVTEGLRDEFGPDRVMDTPISECGFVGAAMGLALAGYRPVVDLMFADFAAVTWDQIVNEIAKHFYLSDGQMAVPLVIRAACGGGARLAAQHSQTTESWYLSAVGIKVALPSSPQDAYGLLRQAIDDPGPVVVLEHKVLYGTEGPFSSSHLTLPIGRAEVLRPGSDITVVASLAMVRRALEAGEVLAAEGIDVEVVDLRTLIPLDVDTISESVSRTGRLVTVEEQSPAAGWGSHVIASVVERGLAHMRAAPKRIGLPAAPLPFSPVLEDEAIPTADRIAAVVREAVA